MVTPDTLIRRDSRRLRLSLQRIAGVAGPATFIGAWVVAGALTPGYSPVDDAISDLAAIGAPTRGLMTAGLIGFGVALPVYSTRLREQFRGTAWIAAAASGVFTLGVAAVPLGRSPREDLLHGALAAGGYAALALTPFLAAGELEAQGRVRSAAAWRLLSTTAALILVATVAGPAHGALQRVGLTILDAWVVATAIRWRPIGTALTS